MVVQVWARQRSSIYSYDCLNGFLMAAIMSYLAANRVGGFFNKSMNAMQIFRVTLGFIGMLLLCRSKWKLLLLIPFFLYTIITLFVVSFPLSSFAYICGFTRGGIGCSLCMPYGSLVVYDP